MKPETQSAAEQVVSQWSQAMAAVEQAESAVAAGDADEATRNRVAMVRTETEDGTRRAENARAQVRREAQLLTDLEEAWLARSQLTANYFDQKATLTAYDRAFQNFGFNVLGDAPTDVANGLKALRPELRTAAVLALDDWSRWLTDAKIRQDLRQIADKADDDPWRRKLRAAETLAALEALVEPAMTEELPVVSLHLLANALDLKGSRPLARKVYQRAERLYPADFWIQFYLASTLGYGKERPPEVIEEQVGHYRAALAARPRAAVTYLNLGRVLREKGDLEGAMASWRKAVDLDPKVGPSHYNLGIGLEERGDLKEALASFRKGVELDPNFASGHVSVANLLAGAGDMDGALAACQKALLIDPKSAHAYSGLGSILRRKHDLDGATAAFRKAIELDSKWTRAYSGLGEIQRRKKDLEGAIATARTAVAVNPKDASGYIDLSIALFDKRDLAGALTTCRDALAVAPKDAHVHSQLSIVLWAKGDAAGAIAAARKAIELNPWVAEAYTCLGNALLATGDMDGAAQAYRKTIALVPEQATAYSNLSSVLRNQGDLEGARAACIKAIELDPTYVSPYMNFGLILRELGDLEGAVTAYRKVSELDPKHGFTQGNLGNVLKQLGRFAEAQIAYHRAVELLASTNPAEADRAGKGAGLCQRLLEMEKRLPDLLAEKDRPRDNTERLDLADLCKTTRRFAQAVRLYTEAFTADPKLAGNIKDHIRYNAACFAALAAAGKDLAPLDDRKRAALRAQALDWLRADLDERAKALTGSAADRKALYDALGNWQTDSDLASLREPPLLKQLPMEEQNRWRALWEDVATLRKKIQP